MFEHPRYLRILTVQFLFLQRHGEQLLLVEFLVGLQLCHLMGCLLHRLLILNIRHEFYEVGELRLGRMVASGVFGGKRVGSGSSENGMSVFWDSFSREFFCEREYCSFDHLL
jgi:hypothetical protein